jgi:gliding motility-associated-like protein
MISVYPNPIADFDISPNRASVLDSKIQFTDLSNNVTYWNWYFGDGDSSHIQHPAHIYTEPGDYYPFLLVSTSQGCIDTISKRVIILKDATFYAPSAFTPNNDGYNDVFQVYGIDLEKGKFEMMVFSRWGEMVFHSEDYNYGWNGSMNGNKDSCPDGTYVWKIRYTDGFGRFQTANGHVTLIR